MSIASLAGEGGILNKASTAKEENKKREYEEVLKLIRMDLQTEKVTEQLSMKVFMDRYKEKIEKHEEFKEAKEIKRKGEGTIVVITQEGYLFLVTEKQIEYLGEQSGEVPPDLDESNVTFIITPEEEWTKENVVVQIIPRIEGYFIEYSMDEENWDIYTGSITLEQNGSIYARLTNGLEEAGRAVRKEITKIDKKPPTGSMSLTRTKTSIKVTTSVVDEEKTNENAKSGIKGYYYSIGGEENYLPITTSSEYTFSSLLPGKKYDILVKVVDNAGNELILNDSISTLESIYIVQNGVLKNSNYIKTDTRQSISQANGYVLWDALECGPQSYGLAWFIGDGSAYTRAVVRLSSPKIHKEGGPGGLFIRCGTTPAKSSQSESTAYSDASYGYVGMFPNDHPVFSDVQTWTLNLEGTRGGMYLVLQACYRSFLWPKGREYHIYDLYLE